MADDSVWGDPKVTISAPNSLAVDFSVAGNNLAAGFADAELSLGTGDGPLGLRQVVAIRAPIRIPAGQKLVGYRQELSFSVVRTVGVHALIVAELAGTVKVVEYEFVAPAGDTTSPDSIPVTGFESPRLCFSAQGLEVADGGVIDPAPDYEATIMLMIRRRSVAETGILSLDGLDVAPVFVPTLAPTA